MGNPICAMIDIDRRGDPSKVRIQPAIFESNLAFGTILFGTMVNSIVGNHKYLVCDNVFQYKGLDMNSSSYTEKLDTIHKMMGGEISPVVYSHNFMSFVTPCMFSEFSVAAHTAQHSSLLAYNAYCVQSWRNEDSTPYGIVHSQDLPLFTNMDTHLDALHTNARARMISTHKNTIPLVVKKTLSVRCESPHDTYSFYDERTKTRKTLCVPTFQNSVMLNAIFRTYKENSNLDTMEESDSDDDFEDMSDDKYSRVGEERSISCMYNTDLSGWVGLNAC
jgi:hypothetical protein